MKEIINAQRKSIMYIYAFGILEIKPCEFESTIRDMEAERYKDK